MYGDGSWSPLYGFLGGNPLAAMPSLHFATSLMAAHMLAETGPVAGAAGWTYAGDARLCARLPRRALRRRPRRRRGADRGDPAGGAARDPRPRRRSRGAVRALERRASG